MSHPKKLETVRYRALPVWGDGTYELNDQYIMGVDVAISSPADKTVITVMKRNEDGTVVLIDGRELNKHGEYDAMQLYDHINRIAYYYRDLPNENKKL